MKRFLITTALEQTWYKADVPVLFLGEWCKLVSEKHKWEALTHETLPYHWDDRKRLYRDYCYLDNLYEKSLVLLTESMNQLHKENNSLRYWRIITGPWLYSFIQILYDRYLSIKTAEKSGKVTGTLIERYKMDKWVPRDFRTFLTWYTTDSYNHYLYSRIIEIIGKINYNYSELKTEIDLEVKDVNRNYYVKWRQALKNIANLYTKLIPNRYSQIVIVSSYLKNMDLIKLQLSLNQAPYVFPPFLESPINKINPYMRNQIELDIGSSEFESILSKIINSHIPINYIEGYKEVKSNSIESFPKNPHLIFTANAHDSNDHFKFWSAHHVDRGIKLIGTQHGGHYGTGLWASADKHELKIFDKYFTWGWESKEFRNAVPHSAGKLNCTKNIKSKKNGRILMVLCTLPRYSYHLYSAPVAASGMLAYFNDQYCFVRALSKENQMLLSVRLSFADYGWDQKKRWKTEFPEIECCTGRESMLAQLKESRLIISTYNATTFLESFSANFPTIMFWNPEHWELNSSAQPYYDELRHVGILHDTPESAAYKVKEIIDDPESWWYQTEIQKVKDQFCFQFGRTSDNWLPEWKTALQSTLYLEN